MQKNGQLEEDRVTAMEARSQSKLLNHTKNRTPGMCLATCLRSTHGCAYVTIFSIGGKFWNFVLFL